MRIIILFVFSLLHTILTAQITINEVCADNESIFADEEGDYEDWIELHNSSSVEINLQGYWLSDDESLPNKWSFPAISIPANGFLLIIASDKNYIDQYAHTNFKISKSGETLVLSNPQLALIDQFILPPQTEDESYGRQPDGSTTFQFFFDPSPGISNNNSSTYNFANPPTFVNTSFFENESILVKLNCDQADCAIYYTIDGSIPDENASLYNEPFTIDTTTSIRAISVSPTLFSSAPTTRTFFINESHEIPVVAITTAPENLWDWETGIFIEGPNADTIWPFFGANYWDDTEIPIHMEFFDQDLLKIEYPLGAKIHGGKGARTKPMKPLRLLAKSSFGTTLMDYPFFENRSNTKFERLVLRNSSGDFNIGHMRDEFLARYFIDEGLDFDAIAEQPIVVYVNGVYWGVMHLREKIDKFYLQHNYGIDPDNIDLLEEDTFIVEGDFNIFNQHEDFILNNDLSDPSNFDIAASYFDLESLTDYLICQTYVNNTDWPSNNIKYWRLRTDTSKWRYMLFDMDVAMGLFGWTKADKNSFEDKMGRDDVRMIAIFKAFLKNESYYQYFINRYADLTNSTFRAPNLKAEVIRSKDEIASEMERHLPRWGKAYDHWEEVEIQRLITFAIERPAYARQFVKEYFGLPSEDQIYLNTFPAQAGSIQVNTIEVPQEEMPWEAHYFNAIPIRLTVTPKSGFTFSHWESNQTDQIISENPSITIKPENGVTYTAIFDHQTIEAQLEIIPNPVSNILNLYLQAPKLDQVKVNIYDTSGRQVLATSQFISSTGINQLELNVATLNEGVYFIRAVGDHFSAGQRFVKLNE